MQPLKTDHAQGGSFFVFPRIHCHCHRRHHNDNCNDHREHHSHPIQKMNWENRGASIKTLLHNLNNLQRTGLAQLIKDRICTICKRQDLHNLQKTGFALLQDKV